MSSYLTAADMVEDFVAVPASADELVETADAAGRRFTRYGDLVIAASPGQPATVTHWPAPKPEMLAGDQLFDAIWRVIKSWDVNVPTVYSGYTGATGNHARAIYDEIVANPETRSAIFQCPRCGVKLPDMDGCEGCDDPLCGALMRVLQSAESLLSRTDFWHSGDGNGLVYLVDAIDYARTFIHSDLEPGGTRSAIFPVNGYLCRHEKLKGASGTCTDCGWSIQVYGRPNPYGGLTSQREYSEYEQAQGKAIADAISR